MDTTSPIARTPLSRGAARLVAAGTALCAIALVGACVPEDGGPPAELTFWTPHTTPDRLAQQEDAARAFTKSSGISVEVVPMSPAEQNAAIGDDPKADGAPDVVLIGADQAAAWAGRKLLDTEVSADVVDRLGAATFSPAALSLVSQGEVPVAVPSDAWAQVLVYRKDLFEQAKLPAPKSLSDVANAAKQINTDGVAGIALGTSPSDPFTAQALESVLVGNGCGLTDRTGRIALGSPRCLQGLRLYGQMASASPVGPQDADRARRSYLAGESAMVLGSSHLLDEVAGLAPDTAPVCDECQDDARFLAEHSGVVTTLTASEDRTGSPYGGTLNLGVPRWADAKKARAFVEYLMTDGYLDSLKIAPEGRVPVRLGAEPGSTKFTDAWANLPSGEGRKHRRSLSEVYDEPTLRAVAEGARSATRWGGGTARSTLAGELNLRGTLTKDISTLIESGDATAYAAHITQDAEQVRAGLD